MKIGKIYFENWKEYSPTQWVRLENRPFSNTYLSIVKIYGRHTEGYAWYPNFHGEFEYLNESYAISTGFKEFKYNEEKEAMKYVDEFLLRLAKLKAFW